MRESTGVVANHQNRVSVDLAGTRKFVREVRRALGLNGRSFDVSLVDDREIARLNATYRGKRTRTDVLSFPMAGIEGSEGSIAGSEGFLGDVIISVETARRNARRAEHSLSQEICWLILHGTLHLLGHDHETDGGEMSTLELSLRDQLGISGDRGNAAAARS